jgi:hypothetical protein
VGSGQLESWPSVATGKQVEPGWPFSYSREREKTNSSLIKKAPAVCDSELGPHTLSEHAEMGHLFQRKTKAPALAHAGAFPTPSSNRCPLLPNGHASLVRVS